MNLITNQGAAYSQALRPPTQQAGEFQIPVPSKPVEIPAQIITHPAEQLWDIDLRISISPQRHGDAHMNQCSKCNIVLHPVVLCALPQLMQFSCKTVYAIFRCVGYYGSRSDTIMDQDLINTRNLFTPPVNLLQKRGILANRKVWHAKRPDSIWGMISALLADMMRISRGMT